MKKATFRTLNKNLVTKIYVGRNKSNQLKLLKKHFGAYEKKMNINSVSFFKANRVASNDFMKYTVNTIYDKIVEWIKKDKLNVKTYNDLINICNNLVKGSREYQEQKKANEKIINEIENGDDLQLYDYIITHPISTKHSDECAYDLANSPYTKEEAIEIMKRKPNHRNCKCHLVKENKLK